MGQKNREDWQQIFSDWKQSGMTKEAFCLKRQITMSRFYYHQAKLNQATTKAFKKVEVVDDFSDEASNDITITFPNGASLALSGLTLSDIKELLS